ncbi:sigma-70 family RNA polymerase sigma factor [Rossellomorea aquimaris]|uniref:sigma-70 family RNA polymerase sigma factor n=1 Tax=Rossellomorea aquimaris TaxID=189382 RepID=UPI0007D09A61|nr:sigma-70 family RNA polymerase sigma factor [Rossellomorea aquimaris]
MRGIRDNATLEGMDEWLETIMDEYGERLTKVAFNYVKDWKMAEDIVQEVFITCYKQYENIDKIISFKSWIFRITINRSKDVLKSSSFRKMVMNSSLFNLFTSQDLSPERSMVKRTEEEFLSKCVLALPVKYREVIILYYYEELSMEEIGGILNMNLNTIKTRLNRGRNKLKNMMERGEYSGEQA